MTPSAEVGMGNPTGQNSVAPNNLYNSISSTGVAEGNSLEQSQQPVQQNPAEQFLHEFSQAFTPMKDLLSNANYAFATKEADLLKRAMQNYMEAVVTGLSVQATQEGGESLGATPPY